MDVGMTWTGNPAKWAVWEDDSRNRELAEAGRACHALRFEEDLLSRFLSRYTMPKLLRPVFLSVPRGIMGLGHSPTWLATQPGSGTRAPYIP